MSMAMQYPFLYLGKSGGYLDIVDISDPTRPTSIAPFGDGLIPHECAIKHIDLFGNRARILGPGVILEVDVSDPVVQPVLSRTVIPQIQAKDMAFRDNLIYAATTLGLEIFQISSGDSVSRTGYFDISPYLGHGYRRGW